MTPSADLNSPMTLLPQFNGDFSTEEQISLISRIAAASIGSQGTVGGLVIAGIVRLPFTKNYSKVKIIYFSFLKPLAGEFWWLSAASTYLCTLMNAYRGLTRPKRGNSKSNTLGMQRES